MLVYMSDWGANLAMNSPLLYLDGTFSSSPHPYAQVYIILAGSESGGKAIPVGYSLLPNKETATYIKMLRCFKEKMGGEDAEIACTTIVMDFESAMFNAL